MLQFNYKGRINRNKLSLRSLRYALADQLVRLYPPLAERWLFPTEAARRRDVAERVESFPMNRVTETPPPAVAWLTEGCALGRDSSQFTCSFRDVTVTGQAGAMIKDGRFLASPAKPDWAIALRPRRHATRALPDGCVYYNLLSPAPAIGHIYHWLFDHVAWAALWLSRRQGSEPVSLLVNARTTDFQRETIRFLCERFSLREPTPVAVGEAVVARRLASSTVEPWDPTAINATDDAALLDQLGRFLRRGAGAAARPRRFYVTRNDARLRRVVNEESLLPLLARRGFARVSLAGMPIADQAALFMDAEAIVAAHGAGLAHIAWCRPGTHLIEFIPSPHGKLGRFRGTAAFWIIACQRRLRYQACEGGVKLNRHDYFEIPERVLEESLDRADLPA